MAAAGCEYRVATGVRSVRLVAHGDDAAWSGDCPDSVPLALRLPAAAAVGGHVAALQLSREASWCATSERGDGACRGCSAGAPLRPPTCCPRDVVLVRTLLAHAGEWPPPDDVTWAAHAQDATRVEQRRAA